MNTKHDENVLFNYIENNKTKNPSLLKITLWGGVYFAVAMFMYLLFIKGIKSSEIHIFKLALLCVIGGLFWGFFVYLIVNHLQKKVKHYNPKNFISEIPQSIGNIAAQFQINHLQIDHSFGEKLVIGGYLFVGDKEIAFIPHKFNRRGKPIIKKWLWSDITSIYKASGGLKKSSSNLFSLLFERFVNRISHKIVIEVDGKQEYLSSELIDEIVDALNTFKASTT